MGCISSDHRRMQKGENTLNTDWNFVNKLFRGYYWKRILKSQLIKNLIVKAWPILVNFSHTHGKLWSICWILIYYYLCNHFKWQRPNDINSTHSLLVTLLHRTLVLLHRQSAVLQLCPGLHSLIVTLYLLMCDNCDIIAAMWHRAGSGTADHGVPDEVRRHRHHLPLPGLVTLHRGQQVDSMLCFSSYKTYDDIVVRTLNSKIIGASKVPKFHWTFE